MICDMMVGKLNTKRALAGAIVFFAALWSSGCVQQQRPEKDDIQMATTPEQVRRAPTQPALRPAEAEAEKPKKRTTAAAKEATPDASGAPADQPVYSASELVGKSRSEVTALIGAPARVEQRAASTVWTYQRAECGLDVFFFLDMATSDERVLTIESTSDPAAPAADAAAAPATGTDLAGTADPATATTGTGAGAATSEGSTDAAGGSVVDTCYGILRRS
jgi:hypothetical protein